MREGGARGWAFVLPYPVDCIGVAGGEEVISVREAVEGVDVEDICGASADMDAKQSKSR